MAMAAQVHLAHPAFGTSGDAQCLAFVIAQRLPALKQRGDREVIVGQAGQATGQRALVEQPVKGGLVDVGRQP
ncbi:hypothetical protein PPS11_18015 [Pseudomonas putida S11]|nr:hypothetical protein PPS11_18015 [Pseudomonas putida S11]